MTTGRVLSARDVVRHRDEAGTYLVDGRVAGAWTFREGRVVLDPYEELSRVDRAAVEDERAVLEAFHA